MISAYRLEVDQIATGILNSYVIGKQLDPSHQLTPEQVTLLQLPHIVLPFLTSLQEQTSDSLASESSWPEHQILQEAPVTEFYSGTSSSSQLPRESWETLEDLLQNYPATLSTEARATFSNTIVPLLQKKWATISPELQKTIIYYFAHGGVLYPQVLQNCLVSEWVSQSILQDLSQEALSTNNPSLRYRFLSAMLPLQQSQPGPVFTQFLLALQKKQQQYSLDLSTLCQVLEYLPLHTEQACALVKQPDDTWISQIKATWLQPRLAHLSETWDGDKCQILQEYLTSMSWSASLTADFLDALQTEQDYPATERFLRFLSQHFLEEGTLMEILLRGPPQDGSSPCQSQRWHREAACSILVKTLKQLFPTHAIVLQTHTTTLLQQHLSTYDALKKLLLQLLKATTNATQRTAQGQQLATVLALLVDYQAASDLVERALATLAECPVNKWVQTVHQILVKATFQDSHELTPSEITSSIAQSAPQANFAGDAARLLASYHALVGTYQGPSSILSHKAPISSWEQAKVTQWAQQVKAGKKKVSQSEMLAVIQRAIELQHDFRPRDTQLLSVLTLLNPAQNTSRISQINTGEDKSLIVAMIAAIHSLQGQQVDVLTTSSELALPEVRKQQPFFSMLSLTVGQNSLPGKSDADKQAIYQKDIVYGTAEDFQADILRTEFFRKAIRGKRGFGVVIVDEVDSLLFDDRSHSTRLSSPMPGMDLELETVLATIWHQVHFIASRFRTLNGPTYFVLPGDPAPDVAENKILVEDKVSFIKAQTQAYLNSLLRELTLEEREQLKDYEERTIRIEELASSMSKASDEQRPELEAQLKLAVEALETAPWKQAKEYLAVPQHLQEFARSQIPHWIDSAILALFHYKKDQHYDIKNGKIVPIDYENTGVLQHNTVWDNGLAQFLQIKEGLAIQPEQVSNNFISKIGYFKRYGDRLYGVTGTLGNQATREFLSAVYKTDMVVVPPYKERQIAGNDHSAYRCKELLARILPTEESWYKATQASVLRSARNGQAVLVICKYIRQVQYLKEQLQSQYAPDKIYTYTGKQHFDKTRVSAGEIILATNIAGRGTDLTTDPEVEANGGLHVCITFLPANSRVELQNAGRAARQGQKGTAQLILLHPDKRMAIEALRAQRDQQEAATLSKAKSEVADMLLQDWLFKRYCELEAQLLPTVEDLDKLNLLQHLRNHWAAYSEYALAPDKVQIHYRSYIQHQAQAQLAQRKEAATRKRNAALEAETASAPKEGNSPLSAAAAAKSDAPTTTDPAANDAFLLAQIDDPAFLQELQAALKQAFPEAAFVEQYTNYLQEQFIYYVSVQQKLPADVLSAFLYNQPLDLASTTQAKEWAKQYG
ncbi:MAG: DEAD/DEAH box helicase [Bacteroidota bacterium]